MSAPTEKPFKCPHCGHEIDIANLVDNQIRDDLAGEYEAQKEAAIAAAKQESDTLHRKAMQEKEALMSVEIADLHAQLVEKQKLVETSHQQELALRQKGREMEQKQKQIEIELQRRIDAERDQIARSVKQQLHEEYSLQLREKEKQITDLRQSVAEVKRKSDVSSQERQGEVLEEDLESTLSRLFPLDNFSAVAKGTRGADILQEVCNDQAQPCGLIIWEAKNTQNWNNDWIEKLKEDQRRAGAVFAVIVSITLPRGLERFGQVEGVWVCDPRSYAGLTLALRKYLVDMQFTRLATQGKKDKMDLIYDYLSGDEFKHRIEAIVESFTAMQAQLAREKRAMEKLWKEREKQIEKVTGNTVGMYGEMQGIIGSGLPTIKALELDAED